MAKFIFRAFLPAPPPSFHRSFDQIERMGSEPPSKALASTAPFPLLVPLLLPPGGCWALQGASRKGLWGLTLLPELLTQLRPKGPGFRSGSTARRR